MALVSAPGLWVPQVGASRLEGLTPQKKGHTRVPYAETPVPPEGGGGDCEMPLKCLFSVFSETRVTDCQHS